MMLRDSLNIDAYTFVVLMMIPRKGHCRMHMFTQCCRSWVYLIQFFFTLFGLYVVLSLYLYKVKLAVNSRHLLKVMYICFIINKKKSLPIVFAVCISKSVCDFPFRALLFYLCTVIYITTDRTVPVGGYVFSRRMAFLYESLVNANSGM